MSVDESMKGRFHRSSKEKVNFERGPESLLINPARVAEEPGGKELEVTQYILQKELNLILFMKVSHY